MLSLYDENLRTCLSAARYANGRMCKFVNERTVKNLNRYIEFTLRKLGLEKALILT